MPSFTDEMTLRFLDDGFVEDLLKTRLGLVDLFLASYQPADVELKTVELVGVRRKEFAVPAFETLRRRGVLERTLPSAERTQVTDTQPRRGRLEWIDVRLDALVTTRVHDQASPLREVRVTDLAGDLQRVTTLTGLRHVLEQHYPPATVSVLLERLRIRSVEDFRRSERLVVKFLFDPPLPFDPADPASVRLYPLAVCVLLRSTLDVTGTLRAAKLCRSILENEMESPEVLDGAEVRHPHVLAVIFPESTLDPSAGPARNQLRERVRSLFKQEGILVHFHVGS